MIAMAAHSFRMSGSSRLADTPGPAAAHSLHGRNSGDSSRGCWSRGASRIPFADLPRRFAAGELVLLVGPCLCSYDHVRSDAATDARLSGPEIDGRAG